MIIDQYRFAAAGDITTGLIDWVKFDDGSGTHPINSGSSGNGLSVSNAGWTSPGFIGPYRWSVPGDGNYTPRNTTNIPNLTGDQTISLWYNKLSTGNVNKRLACWTDSTHSLGIQFVFDHSGTMISVVSSDGSAYHAADTSGAWHLVVGTFTNGVCVGAYLDNVLMTSTDPAATFGADSSAGFGFGNKTGGGSTFAVFADFDDGRRFTRLLTSADRTALLAYR